MTWWLWLAVLVLVGPLVMLACAFVALTVFFLVDVPRKCEGCGVRLTRRTALYLRSECRACMTRRHVEEARL